MSKSRQQKILWILSALCVLSLVFLGGWVCGGYYSNKSAGHSGNAGLAAVQMELPAPTVIYPHGHRRGVLKADVDTLRGTRGHASRANAWNARTVLEDYARVGITLSSEEAEEISEALRNYTSYDLYTKMRSAASDAAAGNELDDDAKKWLGQYQSVVEYTRIAPSYPKDIPLYRRIGNKGPSDGYANWLLSLKPGDDFDLGRTSSFGTDEGKIQKYAGENGIVLEIVGGVNDGVSLSGFSVDFEEKEVLVSERLFTVESVRQEGGQRRIILRLKKPMAGRA